MMTYNNLVLKLQHDNLWNQIFFSRYYKLSPNAQFWPLHLLDHSYTAASIYFLSRIRIIMHILRRFYI